MRDRLAERAVLRGLLVDVDPLVVLGRISERVDARLVHEQPLARAATLPHLRLQLLAQIRHVHPSAVVRRMHPASGPAASRQWPSVTPPSTTNVSPVIQPASSLSRNAPALDVSSG